jgi:hypothetical protein
MRYILRPAFLAVLFAFATSAHAQDCSTAYQTAPSGTQVPPDPRCSGRSEEKFPSSMRKTTLALQTTPLPRRLTSVACCSTKECRNRAVKPSSFPLCHGHPPGPLLVRHRQTKGSATDRLHPKPPRYPRLHKLEIHLDGNGVENTRRHRQSKRLALPAGIPSDTAPSSKQ